MSSPRTIKWTVTLMVAALATSLVPSALGSHEEGASVSIRQEARPDAECAQFFVEVDDASNATAELKIRKHLDGSAPDVTLHEEEITGAPDAQSGGFDFVAGPYDRNQTLGASTDLYVSVSWRDASGFHSMTSDLFNLRCEGGPGPIPDCPANVEAEALEDGSIRVTWDAVEGADSYNVYVATQRIPFAIAGSSENEGFVYEDAEPGETYIFNVRTFADGSEASGCAQVEVTAIPFFGAPLVGALAMVGAVGAYAWIGRSKA